MAEPGEDEKVASETGEEGVPGGGSDTPQTNSFLGGFPGSWEVDVREQAPLPSIVRRGRTGLPNQTITGRATLAELRQIGRGGYQSNDVWEPINENPGVIAQLQSMLVDGGLLDDDAFTPGYYDDSTISAYRKLLTRANAMGTSWMDTINRLRSNPAARLASASKKSPASLPNVTHPDDLRSIFRGVARRTMGQGLPDDVMQRMIDAYQAEQVRAQTTAQDGVQVAPPDVEVFADQQVRKQDPVRYDARKVLNVVDVIAQMMRGDYPSERVNS